MNTTNKDQLAKQDSGLLSDHIWKGLLFVSPRYLLAAFTDLISLILHNHCIDLFSCPFSRWGGEAQRASGMCSVPELPVAGVIQTQICLNKYGVSSFLLSHVTAPWPKPL